MCVCVALMIKMCPFLFALRLFRVPCVLILFWSFGPLPGPTSCPHGWFVCGLKGLRSASVWGMLFVRRQLSAGISSLSLFSGNIACFVFLLTPLSRMFFTAERSERHEGTDRAFSVTPGSWPKQTRWLETKMQRAILLNACRDFLSS